jgi:hypothetical protein
MYWVKYVQEYCGQQESIRRKQEEALGQCGIYDSVNSY